MRLEKSLDGEDRLEKSFGGEVESGRPWSVKKSGGWRCLRLPSSSHHHLSYYDLTPILPQDELHLSSCLHPCHACASFSH